MSDISTERLLAPGDARQTLRQIVATHGPDVRQDPRRCEALLRDLCPAEKREINLLLTALRERVPDDLLAAPPGQPAAVLVARLGKRLVDTLGLADESARWAVGSWALALGVASEADLPAPAPAPPPYVPPPVVPPAPPPAPAAPPPPPNWRQPPPFPTPDWRRQQPPAAPPVSNVMLFGKWILIGILILIIATMVLTTAFPYKAPSSNASAYRPSAAVAAGNSSFGSAAPADPAGMPVRRWDAARPVSAIALSPDGRTVATGGFKLITLWDAVTGKKQRDIALTPHPHPVKPDYMDFSGPKPGEVERLCFSPDGKHLASSAYGIVTLWDAGTGRKERTEAMPTVTDTDSALGTDSEGHWVQSTTVRQVPTTNQHILEFSPDGKSLAADADGSALLVWDTGTGKRRSLVPKTDASVLAFSPDGRTLAGGGSDGVVHLWDAATGRQQRTIRVPSQSAADDPYGHTQYFKDVNAVAFSPDGKTLATGHQGDTNVRFWDAQTGTRGRAVPTGTDSVTGMALRPDGAFVCLQQNGGLNLRDGSSGKTLHKYVYQAPGFMSDMFLSYPRGFALSADGQTLAAGGNGGSGGRDANTVAVWKVAK